MFGTVPKLKLIKKWLEGISKKSSALKKLEEYLKTIL